MYKLKQLDEDFVVKEISKFDQNNLKSQGKYLYFRLKKKDWNTVSALYEISRRLNINSKDIGFAGSKDRNAVTEQICSIKVNNKVSKSKLENLDIKEVEIYVLGYLNQPISLGDLEGNSFEIVVRDLEKENYITRNINYFVNYFDEQRFSKNNVIIGKFLLLKDFKEAAKLVDDKKVQEYLIGHSTDFVGALRQLPKKILLLYIHAYQSYLWNETTRLFIESELKGDEKKENNFRTVDYSCGKFVYPNKEKIEQFANLDIPLIGFFTDFDNLDSKIKDIVKKIMRVEKIDIEDFVIKQIPYLSLEGDNRGIVSDLNNLSLSKIQGDELNQGKEKLTLKFDLGKGCYATQVIRQIIVEK